MTLSPISRQVVLQEVFDEGSVPTDEEIYDYASRIGIDVENEPHLLYLARDGLMQALPQGWKPCFDKDKKEIYYFNFKTKKTQWEHPLDEVYRNLVKKARTENLTLSEQIDDDSRTSIKEDLKSFEEASLIMNEMFGKPKKLEPLSPLGKVFPKKPLSSLNLTKKTISKELMKTGILKSPLQIEEEKLSKKLENEDSKKKIIFEETEVRKRPNSSDIRNRRNIGPIEFRNLGKQEMIMSNPLEKLSFLTDTKKIIDNKFAESPTTEHKRTENGIATKDEGYGTEFSISSLGEKDFVGKKELTLTGGGSVFLKSSKMKSSPSSDLVTSSFSREELSDGLLSPDVKKSGSDLDSGPKSILREQNDQKLHEKTATLIVDKKLKEDDDERKSVRFHFEKELKITFELPNITDSDVEESGSHSFRKNISDKVENISSVFKDVKENKQIEVDFDDLDINFSEGIVDVTEKVMEKVPMDVPNIAEPRKFKSSQTLVKEFREIFENKSKSDIKLVEDNKIKNIKNSDTKSSLINGSKGISSQNGDILYSSEANKLSNVKENKDDLVDNLMQVKETKKSDILDIEDELKSKDFDSVFDDLVEFAIKKKLDIDPSKNEISAGKISYREKEFLLNEILKDSDSDSINESEGDKLFLPDGKELEYLEKLESQINLKSRKRKELEDKFLNTDQLKNEKLNNLEQEYNKWLENIEETYENKKKESLNTLKENYETWLKDKEKELESMYQEKFNEDTQTRFKELRNEFLKKEDEEVAKLKTQLESEQKERLNNLKKEIEIEEEKELKNLRENFEESLNEKKNKLLIKHKEEIEKIEKNLENLLSEQKTQKLKELELARENEAVIEVMRLEMKENYQKQKNNLMNEHESLLENMRKEHALLEEQLKIEFKNEEEALKKNHMNRLEEIKMRIEATENKKALENNVITRAELTEARVCEKVRCEKRLLEDKYKTLKEKYIRLKTESKYTLERKKKKKELSGTTTGSETEKSSSSKLKQKFASTESDSSNLQKTEEFDKKLNLKKQINNLDYLYQTVSTEEEENLMSPKNLPHFQKSSESIDKQLKNEEKNMKLSLKNEKSREDIFKKEEKREGTEVKKRRQLFARFKAASTSKINSSNKNNHQKEDLSPVENLRRQLKKLEELEDQFPLTTYTDTYMRYPFTDNPQFGSSEIEFFKHRIHLERESIKRAKDSLKAQKKSFENRQRELKQKLIVNEPRAANAVNQIFQEEKELTDMEVSVHRTRALLGEKIIRLRHLEQSLKRLSHPSKKESFAVKGKDFLGKLGVRNQKDDDRTLSDLSSYSESSGFSSTDFNDTRNLVGGGGKKSIALEQNRVHFQNSMQESSEIIKSLENLNSEIREIWEVLKKQHQSGKESITMLPPPPLIYGDLGWRTFTLSPPLPYRNTVITSTSNYQKSMAQQFKTQITGSSNLAHMSTITIDSSLIDRTKSLRDWLKAARSSAPSDAISPSQVNF